MKAIDYKNMKWPTSCHTGVINSRRATPGLIFLPLSCFLDRSAGWSLPDSRHRRGRGLTVSGKTEIPRDTRWIHRSGGVRISGAKLSIDAPTSQILEDSIDAGEVHIRQLFSMISLRF